MKSVWHTSFEAIGTLWQIDLYDAKDIGHADILLLKVRNRIDIFDKHYSRFRRDSLVFEMSQRAGTYELPEDAYPMLALYEELYRITNGSMTLLIGQVLAAAGYDADYSLRPGHLQKPLPWEEVIVYDRQKITLAKPALLDFGACGKGYLVDIVADMFRRDGVGSFCIDAGGDIVYEDRQRRMLSVGLEDPQDSEKVVGIVPLLDQSMCGSSGNRRTWGDFHHIIDAETLQSPKHISAVWVVAKTAMLADALTTALFFVSAELLSAQHSFEYLLLFPDRSAQRSSGFNTELFTTQHT